MRLIRIDVQAQQSLRIRFTHFIGIDFALVLEKIILMINSGGMSRFIRMNVLLLECVAVQG
jgi:hypothetical protein